jgi:D-threo-aldose 1-dehydrogenase
VSEAFTAGVRYFDTAPFYGFGLSELRLGKALQGAQPPPVLSTKVGRRLVPTGPQDAGIGREGYFSARPFAPVFDYGYDSVMDSHAESLERLGVSRVDVLLCHDFGRLTHGGCACDADQRIHHRRFYRAMQELRRAGVVPHRDWSERTQVCV